MRSFLERKSWRKYDIYWLLKSCFNLFGNGKYGIFLSQKVDGSMIFTDYWKVLVLNFSDFGNMVFFWVKKLMEKYLLVTQKFLFWTFRWWEIWSFFQPKSWFKDDIYVVYFSFLWYSRAWEIWFFAPCEWFEANKLCLNVEKTEYSLFHQPIRGDDLPFFYLSCWSKMESGKGRSNKVSWYFLERSY